MDWKELAVAYHAHHFQCPTCIAAGRGSQYGQRCSVGGDLWKAYAGSTQKDLPQPRANYFAQTRKKALQIV